MSTEFSPETYTLETSSFSIESVVEQPFGNYHPVTVGEFKEDQQRRFENAQEIYKIVNGFVDNQVGYPVDYAGEAARAFRLNEHPGEITLAIGQQIATPSLRMLKTIAWTRALEPHGLPIRFVPRQWTIDTYVGLDKDDYGTKPGFVTPRMFYYRDGKFTQYSTPLVHDPDIAANRKTLSAINVESVTDPKLIAVMERHPDLFWEDMSIPEFHNALFHTTGLVECIPDRADFDRTIMEGLFLRPSGPTGKVKEASFVGIDEDDRQTEYIRYKHAYAQWSDEIKQAHQRGDTAKIDDILSRIRPTSSMYYHRIPWYFPPYALPGLGIVECFDNAPDIMDKPSHGIDVFTEETTLKPTIIQEAWLSCVSQHNGHITLEFFGNSSGPDIIGANSIPIDLIADQALMTSYLNFVSMRVNEYVDDNGGIDGISMVELDKIGSIASIEFLTKEQ